MYDTVALKSPYISEELALKIFNKAKECEGFNLKLTERIDVTTGSLDYRLTTGSLSGSFDSRISIRLDDQEYKLIQSDTDIVRNIGSKNRNVPIMVKTQNYVYIECSLHKAFLGHNCYGGPVELYGAIKNLILILQGILGLELPDYLEWTVLRVDVAEVFDLGSFEACTDFFQGIALMRFPRREKGKSVHGSHGIFFSGSTTALKLYHKGPELWAHDRTRLKRFLGEHKFVGLMEKANRIVRVEVEVKRRKLKYDFGEYPKVKELNDDYFNEIYNIEVNKIIKEGKEMEIVRDAFAVDRRLNDVYNSKLAGLLMGTWYRLTTLGEVYVKGSMSDRTFRRHKKQLIEAGVSWLITDVRLSGKRLVPVDFSPVRSDSRRVCITLEEALQDLKTA